MNMALQKFIEKHKNSLSQEAMNDVVSLCQDQTYLRKAFQDNPCTICIIDEEGRYIDINTQMEMFFGVDKKSLIGTKVGEHTHNSAIPELIKELRDSDDDQKFKIIESNVNNKKTIFWLSANKIGTKIITTGLDITELRQLEEDKIFNEKLAMIGEMSAFIVHEINNPLSAIVLSNEYIQILNANFNPDIEAQTQSISEMISTITKIIDSLKTMIRKEDDTTADVSINDIFEKSKTILRGKLLANNVSISFENKSELKTIVGSELELLQIFVNLISNSIDAIKNNKEKWIKIVNEDYKIKIIDSGIGITKEIQEKLFQKFYSSKGSSGNGIGLFLSRELLSKHSHQLVYLLENGNTSFQILKNTSDLAKVA